MTFDRRRFLTAVSLTALAATARIAFAAQPRRKLLVLVELKGGNDGLNTVIPYADPQYAALRPRLAIARDQVVALTESTGLHPSLAPLKALWDRKELAVVQGMGYPQPNLSHFRSIEIWDTASASDQYLEQGWLARAFALSPSLPGRSWIATGSGFDAHAWLRDAYREPVAMRLEGDLPRAGAVARVAARRFARGETVAAERAAPLYLREKVALTSEERRQAKR
jgi:uncharacterized protein (DUF1501 family)